MGIKVEFILYGEDFPASDIANQLGIPNPIIDSKGQIRRDNSANNSRKTTGCTSLTYDTGYVDTIDIDVPLNIIYDSIFLKSSEINEYINKYNLTAKFVVVINLTENPVIALSEKIIHLASEMCAEIEFDSYIRVCF